MQKAIAILFTVFLLAGILDIIFNSGKSPSRILEKTYLFQIEGGDCRSYNFVDYQLISKDGKRYPLKRRQSKNEILMRNDLPRGKYTFRMFDVYGNKFESNFNIITDFHVPFDFLINHFMPEGDFNLNDIKNRNTPIYITRNLNRKGDCMFSYCKIYQSNEQWVVERYIDSGVTYKSIFKKKFIDDLCQLESTFEKKYMVDPSPYPLSGSDELEFRYNGYRKLYRAIDKKLTFPSQLDSLMFEH